MSVRACVRCAERKARMRQAVADAAKEIEEYKAMRELKLQSSNPEVCSVAGVCVLCPCAPHGACVRGRPLCVSACGRERRARGCALCAG
ncbi:hypothetical protein EON67_04130 [archaeon]|nr:MAG: hypothetical protein EON67_04130 [archaeon]